MLDPSRVYGQAMMRCFEKELLLPKNLKRIDVVVIVTPNNVHYDPTVKALQRKLSHVVFRQTIDR